ncbi:N-acetylmuramoyl-L-alanine amidase-like domain-containing protein [Gracilimonas tropica]|uniref:N-acetylmuramoyl-L-alanine amidase-like domain-containing protein n=1 Tax=Gracilimonas tropica TaxID=454600 RepID=UPI00037BCD58|nr:N-acetylmuramoyl-L-alanine amidase-like domain-containing protein [Gracilimonas tropica]
MKTAHTFTTALLLALMISMPVHAQNSPDDIVYTEQDVAIFSDIVQQFEGKRDQPISTLIPEIGKYFIGNEYVAHALEVTDEEKLVVNLRDLDCTTYAENLLAIARTLKSDEVNFERYVKELEKIRYRDGKQGDYPTRLHYFSDWIYDNAEERLVTTPADSFGEPLSKDINFMSTHPESYKHLRQNPAFISVVKEQEHKISNRSYFYVPKESLPQKMHLLKEGDIIGLTTSIDGLDVAHVGILVKVGEEFHLMHASQSNLKVEVSEEPLMSFLKPNSSNTGIMVARPVELNQ